MSLKEILEQSPVWVMIVIATGAFFVGVTVTIGIIKILFQDQSKKISTMENLKRFPVWAIIFIFVFGFIAGVGVMRILDRDQPETKIEMGKSSISENTDNKQTTTENRSMKNSDLFRFGNPIPKGFEQLKIGMRSSILKSVFPRGEFSGYYWYVTDIEDNPIIKRIMCNIEYNDENMNDGIVIELVFHLKNSTAHKYIVEQALSAFGSENAISKMQGNILEWKNVEGFNVDIDQDAYRVERAK